MTLTTLRELNLAWERGGYADGRCADCNRARCGMIDIRACEADDHHYVCNACLFERIREAERLTTAPCGILEV